jgi:uncharacterized membrane protein YdjX (TVP38/TMEM64 family)
MRVSKHIIQFVHKYSHIIAFGIAPLFFGIFWIIEHFSSFQQFLQIELVAFIKQFGPYAWLAFLILSILSTMSPFPDSVFTFMSGFLFGPVIGTILTLVGSLIGNSIDFYLARKLGRAYVHKKFPNASKEVDQFATQSGWQSIIVLRLIPNPLPFDWMSYAAGISPISYWKFALSMAVGVLPLQIITVLIGYQLQQNAITYTLFGLVGLTGMIGFLGLLYKNHQAKTLF